MFDPYEHFLLKSNFRAFYVIVLHSNDGPAFYTDSRFIEDCHQFNWTYHLPSAFKFQTQSAAEKLANDYLSTRLIEVVKVETTAKNSE